jgi:hypothetical protein
MAPTTQAIGAGGIATSKRGLDLLGRFYKVIGSFPGIA